MKKLLGDFRDFIRKGNVLDLAVGVIIGGAFQKIVTSVINDLLMPWIGLLTGGVNFVDQFLILKLPEGVEKAQVTSASVAASLGVTTFNYGAFVTAVIDFLIMAFIIFLFIRGINKVQNLTSKPAEEKAPTTKKCPYCLSEINIEATRCPHCTSELEK